MNRKMLSLKIDEELLEMLDKMKKNTGQSKTYIVEKALRELFKKNKDLLEDDYES